MDFVISLPILTNWKDENYNYILIIVNWLTKIVHYKPIKDTINVLGLAKVILDIVVWHYGFPNSIISDKRLLFISKFWLSLYYFFGIKQKLFIVFCLQRDGQTECQNNTMEAYFCVFVNFK